MKMKGTTKEINASVKNYKWRKTMHGVGMSYLDVLQLVEHLEVDLRDKIPC
jgi:hypothetical protein